MHHLNRTFAYFFAMPWITVLAGRLADTTWVPLKNMMIRAFVAYFKVNMTEAAEENPSAYPTFNDFFIRTLKDNRRPIAVTAVTSPVDGVISHFGKIHVDQLLQAKGQTYGVPEFLSLPSSECIGFQDGHYITFYLSPKDYHRVHMPMRGLLCWMTHIPGQLFSVNPRIVQCIPKLFIKNERLVMMFETHFGRMAMVFVGATIVGKIGTTWTGDLVRPTTPKTTYYERIAYEKAVEMGYFKLGSTVVLLWEKNIPVCWQKNLYEGMPICMGEAIAELE